MKIACIWHGVYFPNEKAPVVNKAEAVDDLDEEIHTYCSRCWERYLAESEVIAPLSNYEDALKGEEHGTTITKDT